MLYINDHPFCCDLSKRLFADDTAIYAIDDDIQRLLSAVNLGFQKLCKYFRKNKLSLHPDKTKYLVLSSSQQVQELKTSFFINNNNSISNDLNLFSEISRIFPDDKTPAIKYLGFFFDPNVNFKFHIQSISTKLSIKPS